MLNSKHIEIVQCPEFRKYHAKVVAKSDIPKNIIIQGLGGIGVDLNQHEEEFGDHYSVYSCIQPNIFKQDSAIITWANFFY